MNMIKRFNKNAALCALLLCFSLTSAADEIQDANKLFKQGQHVQALEKVDAFLTSKPKDAQARFLKGLILTEQAKTADAIKVFTALTDDYPELPEPYNNLAVLYAGQGQYEKPKSNWKWRSAPTPVTLLRMRI
jgi:Flp pilus assembly protein TadD